ncbi:MAG: ribose-phosphate diphosphokinase [Proteobacteria bacterium]|nr:ribose-phosphate diphosphokinase [Pseudomonadota bacterium]
MKPLFLAFPGTSRSLATALARTCGGDLQGLRHRRFPDGESYFRIEADLIDRDVVLVCSLDRPDPKTTLLQLVAAALRGRGARRLGLAAPYLAYMRQDASFHRGEPISARLYAALLSRTVDWLATVDPHLHRIHDLAEVYAIPTRVAHATEAMAAWIRAQAPEAFLIGPDEESRQWTAAVAAAAGVPYSVLRKERLGDREVRVHAPDDLAVPPGRTPVLIDDVVSSGRTLIAAAEQLALRGGRVSLCIATHALASRRTLGELAAAGLRVAASDSIRSPVTAFSIADPLAVAVRELMLA